MAKKKAKRKVSTKTKAKRLVKRAEKATEREGKKVKRGAKKVGKKAKRGAKKVGKKVKKFAKTDTGRAGIGAGAGALLLGPVGAVAGAAVGLATRKKNPMSISPKSSMIREIFQLEQAVRAKDPKRAQFLQKKHAKAYDYLALRVGTGKTISRSHPMFMQIHELHGDLSRSNNPEPMVKLASALGSLLLDYHKASPSVEHVAAAAIRGEMVELRHVKAARTKLASLIPLQKRAGDREQIEDLVDALDRKIMKSEKRSSNPARAFSLDTQIKRQRQSRAKKAATSMAAHSKTFGEVKSKSLAAKLRKINPEPVSHSEIVRSHKRRAAALSDAVLKREVDLFRKEPHVSKKGLIHSLTKVYEGEAVTRGMKVNPKTVVRKKGKFHSVYVPTPAEVAEFERAAGRGPKSPPSMLDELTNSYRRMRKRWLATSTKASSTAGEIARARKRMDDAENKLVMYAEISNMSPDDLKRYMRHTEKMQSKAKGTSRKRASNPRKRPTAHTERSSPFGEIPPTDIGFVLALAKDGALGRSELSMFGSAIRSLEKAKMLKRASTGEYSLTAKGSKVLHERYFEDVEALERSAKFKEKAKATKRNPRHTRPEKPTKKKRKTSKAPRPYKRKRPGGGKRNPGGHDFVLAFFECEDRTIPKTKAGIDKKIAACKKELKDIRVQQAVATKKREYDTSEMMEQSSASIHEFMGELYAAKRKSNPKRKASKKKATRKVTPEWQRLTRRCQKLWEHYAARPGKGRLKDVFKHLEKMEGHASKRVREERSRCMRAAKVEAKKLKLKV